MSETWTEVHIGYNTATDLITSITCYPMMFVVVLERGTDVPTRTSHIETVTHHVRKQAS